MGKNKIAKMIEISLKRRTPLRRFGGGAFVLGVSVERGAQCFGEPGRQPAGVGGRHVAAIDVDDNAVHHTWADVGGAEPVCDTDEGATSFGDCLSAVVADVGPVQRLLAWRCTRGSVVGLFAQALRHVLEGAGRIVDQGVLDAGVDEPLGQVACGLAACTFEYACRNDDCLGLARQDIADGPARATVRTPCRCASGGRRCCCTARGCRLPC